MNWQKFDKIMTEAVEMGQSFRDVRKELESFLQEEEREASKGTFLLKSDLNIRIKKPIGKRVYVAEVSIKDVVEYVSPARRRKRDVLEDAIFWLKHNKGEFSEMLRMHTSAS